MRNDAALKILKEYVLAGSITVDAKLLRELGCGAAEADQLLAADQVRELMNHYWMTEELTLDNAQRLLAEWRARNDLAFDPPQVGIKAKPADLDD